MASLRILTFLSLFHLLFIAAVLGDTYIIRPDGSSDPPNIRAAVIAAVDGDTIALAPGEFSGPDNRAIEVNKNS